MATNAPAGPVSAARAGHDPDEPADLARERWWSRFPAAAEVEFQAWLADQVSPLSKAIAWPSLLIWIVLPGVSQVVLGADLPPAIWVLELGVNVPLVVVWLALLHGRRTRGRAVLWSAAAQLLIGATTMYGVRGIFGITAGGAVYTALFFSMLSPFVRLPFRSTAVLAAALDGAAIAITTADVSRGRLALAEAWPSYSFLLTAIVLVSGVSLVGERGLRRSWVQDQVIQRQRARLIENRRLIRRYVPPAVVAEIETGNATAVDVPVRRRVTVMFSDVVGFTAMADRLDPESLTQIINEYLGAVAEIVESHGGTLNEFAGDGFMALFGAPYQLAPEEQVLAAVAASRQIHHVLPRLSERWFLLGADQPVRTRIGINTGVLSVGTFGSEGRATYTGIGLQTNIAARIQAECDPGRILLSQTSWHLVRDRVRCEHRGEVTVKGVHFPINLYEPVVAVAPPGATRPAVADVAAPRAPRPGPRHSLG